MRLSGLCAALAAAALATADTVTITKTVARVHQVSWPSTTTHKNDTQPMTLHTGTGVWSATSTPSLVPATPTVQPATGAAVPIRLDTLGYIAAAGLAGLVAL